MSPHDDADFDKCTDASVERFAAQLVALTPKVQLDRDRLMYLAGQASAGLVHGGSLPSRWVRPTAFAGMTALAASLLLALSLRPAPQVVEKIVQVPMVMPTRAAELEPGQGDGAAPVPHVPDGTSLFGKTRLASPASPNSATYIDLRDRVLAFGIESWPLPAPSSADDRAPPRAGHQETLNRLLHEG